MSIKNRFRNGLLKLALAVCAISVITYHISPAAYDKNYNYCLKDTLNYYGFTSANQKKAIENLLQKSDIIASRQTLDQAFPIRKKESELIGDILRMIQKTQEKFVVRSDKQERWEVSALEWTQKTPEEILSDLKALGFVDPIEPKEKTIDAFCILGARASVMAERIAYAESLYQSQFKAKSIILLGGERYVTKDIDGSEEQLAEIAKNLHLNDWKDLTETHLIQHEFKKSPLSKTPILAHVIDTPRRNLPRPTTQTTIVELIQWLKHHQEIQHIVFVSNQPYVKYQKAIIDLIFKEQNVDIPYEVVGSGTGDSKDLKSLLEALGAYLWAATPGVFSSMNFKIQDPSIQESLRELYSKNPLIYNAFLKNF